MGKASTKHPFGTAKRPIPNVLRMLRGPYTIAELAQVLDIAGNSIQEWEQGTFQPAMGNLRSLILHYNRWMHEFAGPGLDLVMPALNPKRRK